MDSSNSQIAIFLICNTQLMKAILAIALFAIVLSCNTNPNLETRVKNFMKDSVVTGFNDPKSYEFVSMKIDTLTRANYDTLLVSENLKAEIKAVEEGGRWEEKIKVYDSLTNIIRADKGDSLEVIKYLINVSFRSKNLMGALQLNDYKLGLTTKDNKLVVE